MTELAVLSDPTIDHKTVEKEESRLLPTVGAFVKLNMSILPEKYRPWEDEVFTITRICNFDVWLEGFGGMPPEYLLVVDDVDDSPPSVLEKKYTAKTVGAFVKLNMDILPEVYRPYEDKVFTITRNPNPNPNPNLNTKQVWLEGFGGMSPKYLLVIDDVDDSPPPPCRR